MKASQTFLRATGVFLLALMLLTGAFMFWISKAEPTLVRSPIEPAPSASIAPATIPAGFERVIGDVRIELFAYALNVPGQSPNIWRNPATHEELSVQQLREGGTTEGYLKTPNPSHAPVLALLFKTDGVHNLRNTSAAFLDGRTAYQVHQGTCHSILHPSPAEHPESRILEINTALGIWHDTPIQTKLGFDFSDGPVTHSAQLWYEFDALPDMPNGRDIDNLFAAKIPTVTTANPIEVVLRATQLQHEIQAGSGTAAGGVGGGIRISGSGATVSGTTITSSGVSGSSGSVIRAGSGGSVVISSGGSINISGGVNISGGSVVIGGGSVGVGSTTGSSSMVVSGGVISLGPSGTSETYENLTVYELLQRYADSRSGDRPIFEVNPKTMTLIEKYGAERSFTQKVRDWWNRRAPSWIQFN